MTEVPLEPVERDGFSMTFWQYAVLADDPNELPWLTPLLIRMFVGQWRSTRFAGGLG